MFKLYGINRNAFKGVYEAWQASVHPEDVHAANKEVEMALAGQKEFDTEFRVIWPDKSVHYIKSRATVHRDAAGKPLRMLGTNWDITERKQAELELKNSNERNRIFVEQAPNALAMFDTEMRYMAASDKWLEDYNLLDKDIIGRSHYDIFPEIGEDWKTIHRECLQGAINKADEAPFERADGTLQWLTWDVRPWYVSAGQIGGLLMYTADITHIKQKDAERRRIEHILDRSNQIAKIATWEVDAVNDTVKWSDLAYEVFDLPLGVMPTRAQAISFYKEGPNRQRLLAAVQKQIEYGTPYDLELEIETPKGNQKWIRLIGEADFEKGVCKRRFGVLQDITKAKQAEESLNLANEELQAIFNSGYVCIIGTDTRGLITHFNQGAEVLLQYSAAEMIGIHTPAKIHFSDEVVKRGAELSALYNRTIEGFDVFVEMARQGRHESREWTYIRKDGSRFPVQLIVSAIRNYRGEITGFLGVATDITERKMAEEKMRNYSILESKSKEMEQFAYVTSHDLREPLLTIKNYVKLLMEDYGASLTDEYAQIYTTAIVRSVTRMEELIKGVLDYSRLSQVKELKEVNVNNLIKDVQEDLHLLITTTGAVVEIEPLPVINAYGVELKLLFQNLINNAIKFRKKDVKPVIHISAEKIQKGWQFKIEDNGIGIEEKNSQKIFAMFQRLHNRDEYEGTGIGLAQCKKITELHNGQIWVESVPGAFSKFYFTILTD
jgi:PAS domain S-box-containing protein